MWTTCSSSTAEKGRVACYPWLLYIFLPTYTIWYSCNWNAEYKAHVHFHKRLQPVLLGAGQSLCTSLVSGFWRPQHEVCHNAVNVVHFLWRHAVWCSVQCAYSVHTMSNVQCTYSSNAVSNVHSVAVVCHTECMFFLFKPAAHSCSWAFLLLSWPKLHRHSQPVISMVSHLHHTGSVYIHLE